MDLQNVERQSRLHAKTLAMLNHCVDTARRDAASLELFRLAEATAAENPAQRAKRISRCLQLVQEITSATQRSSPILYNARLALADRPVLHFLHLLEQLLRTMQ